MIREELRALVAELRPVLADAAARHDRDGSFVVEHYDRFKERRVFSLGVPAELGGGGASHAELCWLLRELGEACGSTALALSMHQHLVAATVFRHRRGEGGEPLLRRVANEQLVLVSTGAGDWLESNGHMVAVEGGYRVTARKPFASGCPRGDLLVTSAVHEPATGAASVLHFAVPLHADGVRVHGDWDAMGMRGTGSHTVELTNVFVPASAIVVQRPPGEWHRLWNVILSVAVPLYTAPYVGVARAAAEVARRECRSRASDTSVQCLLGELENALTQAELAHDSLVALTNDYDFTPSVELSSAVLVRKTLLANAVGDVTRTAFAAVGGRSYFRQLGLERLARDATGAQFHPLPEKQQQLFTGRVALGLPPVGNPF